MTWKLDSIVFNHNSDATNNLLFSDWTFYLKYGRKPISKLKDLFWLLDMFFILPRLTYFPAGARDMDFQVSIVLQRSPIQ